MFLCRVLLDEISKLEEMSKEGLFTKIADSEEYKTLLQRIVKRIDGATQTLQVCTYVHFGLLSRLSVPYSLILPGTSREPQMRYTLA